MIQKQLFRVFQLVVPEVKHFYQKNTWKNSQITFIYQKNDLKHESNFGKEIASEGVEADIFIYNY